jgi:hypothetical protein
MGMFDWLFGKKTTGGNITMPQASSPPNRQLHGVEGLLQRSKELPPNDPHRARALLAEMLQTAVALPANDERAGELAMALDSMARHYPESLSELAQGNGNPAVRQRAEELLAHRRELANATAPAARTPEDNLRRWGQAAARAWVEARQGKWDHQDWTDLLESLQRSDYWPMNVEDIGQTLEQLKGEWHGRQP